MPPSFLLHHLVKKSTSQYICLMERRGTTDLHDVIIKSGELVICPSAHKLIAIAGSNCVVTFWEPEKKIAALVNYSKPKAKAGQKHTATYGNIALISVIKHLEAMEIDLTSVEAHLIGGGKKYFHVTTAEENIAVAKSILGSKGIDIISEDIGGNKGRKVLFDTRTGQVALLKVQRLRHSDWI